MTVGDVMRDSDEEMEDDHEMLNQEGQAEQDYAALASSQRCDEEEGEYQQEQDEGENEEYPDEQVEVPIGHNEASHGEYLDEEAADAQNE